MTATSSGTAIDPSAQTFNTCCARASLQAITPTGFGSPCSQAASVLRRSQFFISAALTSIRLKDWELWNTSTLYPALPR